MEELRAKLLIESHSRASGQRASHTSAHQTPPVWRAPEGSTAVPVGGGGAWPGFETKHKHTSAHQTPPVWRAPEGSAAVPVGGGGAWPGFETKHKHTSAHQAPLVRRAPEGSAAVPVGGGGARPGFEATRRAKLAARTARGRAAAHRHTQRPGPTAPGTPAVPQRNEAATGCPATASSRSRSAVHNSATSNQAVMST